MRLIFLIVLALGMTLPGIASLPPLDRDESRYVQATKQMVDRGDFIDIRFQDESRYKKPIGIYWLQSLAVLAGGDGPAAPVWHYRLVSVAAILIAVTATFLTGRALFGTAGGMMSALALMAMFGVAFEGRIAKTDAMLLALAVVAQGSLMQIHAAARRNGASWSGLVWLFWTAQGFAILLKGPIVPLLSLANIGTLWAIERDWGWLRRLQPGKGILLAALIAAPWLIAITLVGGSAFWSESVATDMLGKVASGQESHGAPPGYYVLTYGLYVWPLGPLLLLAGLAALSRMKTEAPLLFLLAWYVPFWLLCELIPTKLPHYMLPAYPALSLALGWVVSANGVLAAPMRSTWSRWLFRVAVGGHSIVTLALAAIAVAAPIHLGGGFSFAGLATAVMILVTGWLGLRHAASVRGMIATAIAAAIAYGLLFAAVLPSLDRLWLTPRIVATLEAAKPCRDSVLAASGFHEPSLVFQAGTQTRLTDLDGVAANLKSDPECALALAPAAEAEQLAGLAQMPGRRLIQLARIDGLNYSNGRELGLGLYRLSTTGTKGVRE